MSSCQLRYGRPHTFLTTRGFSVSMGGRALRRGFYTLSGVSERGVSHPGTGQHPGLTTSASSLQMADAMEMMILSILAPQLHCEWRLPSWQVALLTSVGSRRLSLVVYSSGPLGWSVGVSPSSCCCQRLSRKELNCMETP